MTKLMNSNSNKTQIVTKLQTQKTEIETKQKNLNFDKTKKF